MSRAASISQRTCSLAGAPRHPGAHGNWQLTSAAPGRTGPRAVSDVREPPEAWARRQTPRPPGLAASPKFRGGRHKSRVRWVRSHAFDCRRKCGRLALKAPRSPAKQAEAQLGVIEDASSPKPRQDLSPAPRPARLGTVLIIDGPTRREFARAATRNLPGSSAGRSKAPRSMNLAHTMVDDARRGPAFGSPHQMSPFRLFHER